MRNVRTLRSAMRVFALVGFASVLELASAGSASAYAPNEIYACGQTCRTDCTGYSDCRTASGSPAKCVVYDAVSCTSGQSTIHLANGTDLDLQGSITCTETGGSTCGYPAITVDDTGTKISNSGTSEAIVSGPFNVGIDCYGKSGSIVEKITVEDGYAAISNCQTVRNTVVGPSSQFYGFYQAGISTSGISGSDSITDNFIAGRWYPIYSTSTYSLDVLRNVIWGTGSQALHLSATSGNVKFNVVFSSSGGGSTVISSPSGPSFDGNYCAPDITGCASCISSAMCEPYTSPFQGN